MSQPYVTDLSQVCQACDTFKSNCGCNPDSTKEHAEITITDGCDNKLDLLQEKLQQLITLEEEITRLMEAIGTQGDSTLDATLTMFASGACSATMLLNVLKARSLPKFDQHNAEHRDALQALITQLSDTPDGSRLSLTKAVLERWRLDSWSYIQSQLTMG